MNAILHSLLSLCCMQQQQLGHISLVKWKMRLASYGRRYSPPGCRNRRFKDGGRDATLIVLILGFPRKKVGSMPNSSESSLLRLARAMSSSRIWSGVMSASVLLRLATCPSVLETAVVHTGLLLSSCWLALAPCMARCRAQLCQCFLQSHFHSLTDDIFLQALHFCFLSRSDVWKLEHWLLSTWGHVGHR